MDTERMFAEIRPQQITLSSRNKKKWKQKNNEGFHWKKAPFT